MSEIYNANPTIIAVSKPSKSSSRFNSIWMDDFGAPADSSDDDEIEPIDSDEIFGVTISFPPFMDTDTECLP